MGNNNSSSGHPPRRVQSPARDSQSPSRGVPRSVHPSLRHKKKSLELPDLASLTLTPSASGASTPTRRVPRTSAPIPIPVSPNANPEAPRAPRALPSTSDMNELLAPPAHNHNGSRRSSQQRGASAQNSTRSFNVRGSQQPSGTHRRSQRDQRPEVVTSSIPIALPQLDDADGHPKRKHVRPDPVVYKVKWKGKADSVVLARAGHEHWKGRQPMEKDPNNDVWYTTVSVLPGTHHVKFIVDGHWRVSDDYHKAVADDGSLANYISIPIPAAPGSARFVPPPANISFWSAPDDDSVSSTGSIDPSDQRGWTDEIPVALIEAQHQEEEYLTSQDEHSQHSSEYGDGEERPLQAPNIPPAPLLPRFLEKLILNIRPGGGASVAGRDRAADRQRTKAREAALESPGIPITTASGTDLTKTGLGISATLSAGNTGAGMNGAPTAMTPASGTPGVAAARGVDGAPRRPTNMPKLEMPVAPGGTEGQTAGRPRSQSIAAGAAAAAAVTNLSTSAALADDGSVLPVPSHVVLHHLSTSAIKNGVLAVANTTRYRKKYLTTIYYTPT